jgi:hypothetical protein
MIMRAAITISVAFALATLPVRALDAPGEYAGLVHASYETRTTSKRGTVRTQRWSFTRRVNVVEYHWPGRSISEHWRRDARQNVSHQRLHHRETTRVRYTAGDLAALGIAAHWSKLEHVIVPPNESGMTKGVATTWRGHRARRYTSPRLEVTWLEDLALPAEVLSTSASGERSHVRLLALTSPATELAAQHDYRQLDFADFGDMEYDPFVIKHSAHGHQP